MPNGSRSALAGSWALALWATFLLPSAGFAQIDHAYIERECRNEISAMCPLETDLIGCLRRNEAGLMSDCRGALKRGRPPAPAPPPAAPKPSPAPSWRSTAPAGLRRAAAIEESYSGKNPELFRELRPLLVQELPGVLREVAEAMKVPEYAEGFGHPVTIRVVYDPTSQDGFAAVEEPVWNGSEWTQSIAVNLAFWEDCRSRKALRSLLRHELAHAVLRENAFDDLDGAAFPSQWFDEGLATLVGGEPTMTQSFDNAFRRFGPKLYPAGCALRPITEGHFAGPECYPYFTVAVRRLLRASPNAVPKILAGLRSGQPLEEAVQAETGLAWDAFKSQAQADAEKTFGEMGWWNRLRARYWLFFLCRD